MAAVAVVGFVVIALVWPLGETPDGPVVSPTVAGVPASCPVTVPGEAAFTPASEAPDDPPEVYENVWFGTPDLWTLIDPAGEVWSDLPRGADGSLGERTFWWSANYSAHDPGEFTVTAEHLSGTAPRFEASQPAGTGFDPFMTQPTHESVTVVGIELPDTGCWRLTAEYKDATVTYVVWVSDHGPATTLATTTTLEEAGAQGQWMRVVDSSGALGGDGDQIVSGVTAGENAFVAVGEDERAFDNSEDDQAAVWWSESGLEWSRIDVDPSFFDAAMTDVVWFPDSEVYVAVGHHVSEGAVWISEDGRSWERVALLGFDGPSGGIEIEAITVGGPGVVAVGREWLSEGLSIPAVWMSPDGSEWTRVGGLTQFSDNAAMVDVVQHGGTLFAAGFVEQTMPAVWTFADNSFWELIAVGPQIARDAYLTSIASDGQRLVVAGGSDAEDVDARVWTSSDDGQTWVARQQLPSAGGIPNLNDVAVTSSGWFAVGEDSSTFRPNVGAAVWTSPDGIDWSRYSPETAAFLPEAGGVVITSTVSSDAIVIAGGYTGQDCAERYTRCALDAAFWIWLP